MTFAVSQSIEILERTPALLRTWLHGLSSEWTNADEGPETWSAFDVVGHLIHGEKTDWIPRMEIMLSDQADKKFTPFDRFAQKEISKGRNMEELLEEFAMLRKKNLEILRMKNLSNEELKKTGIHPEFGTVNLEQLLATWVAHDLGHLAQIARVMAKRYRSDAGPWVKYLRVLQ